MTQTPDLPVPAQPYQPVPVPVPGPAFYPQQPLAGYPAAPLAAPDAGIRAGRQFAFDGGAATYFGTGLIAMLITVFTLGICYPFALVLRERWRAKHSYIDGFQLRFTGLAVGLFGNWIKWLFLCFITLGIYGFWVGPRIARWKWEHTGFALPVHAQRHA